jgi:iron-sulfur cluster repair protein YtfE (RIC family)
MTEHAPEIHPDMTILEVVYHYRRTEPVFRKYDEDAGVCLLCQALFDSLAEAAAKYGLNLENLLTDLQKATQDSS